MMLYNLHSIKKSTYNVKLDKVRKENQNDKKANIYKHFK